MLSKLLAALTALSLVFASVTAHADPSCTCGADTKNPGRATICDDEPDHYAAHMCNCMNECGGTSSTAPASTVNPAVTKGVVTFFGTIAFLMILTVAPGFAMRMMSKDKVPAEDKKVANALWRKQLAELRTYEQRGVATRRLGQDLITFEKDAARDEAIAKDRMQRLKFNPPALKPSRTYLCDQAALALPFHFGGSIAGFATVADMLVACEPFEKPSEPDEECKQGGLSCGEVCCPVDKPVYNQCDHKCYRTSDFRGGAEAGMKCARFARCQMGAP